MRIANIIAYVLVIVGAINWGLFGLFNLNLVSKVFAGARTAGSVIVYTVIAIAAPHDASAATITIFRMREPPFVSKTC